MSDMAMSAENPYVGAAQGIAGSAAEAYGAGLRFATALREAAAQQAQQQQQQKQQSFQDELEIRKAGGVPFTPPPADSSTFKNANGNGLINRSPSATQQPPQWGQPAPPDAKRIVRDAQGRQWLMPDPDEKDAKANATETGGLLEEGAEQVYPKYVQGATPAGGATPDPVSTGMFGREQGGEEVPKSRVVTPAGGTQGYYVPTADEKAAADMRHHIAVLHAEHDENGVGLPDALARQYEKTHNLPQGSLNGVKFPGTVIGNLLEHMTPTEHKENHDDWVRIASDPKSSPDEQKRANAALKLDDKYYQGRKEPKEAKSDQPKPATPAQSAGIERRKKASLVRAEAAFKKARAAALTPEERQSAEDDLNKAKQDAQDTYEEEIERYGGSTGGAGGQGPGAGNPAASAQNPAPGAKAAPKSAGLAQVRAYAKQKGIPEAKAIKEFKGAGYTIGQ